MHFDLRVKSCAVKAKGRSLAVNMPFELCFYRNGDLISAISRSWSTVSLVLDAIIVIAQYARDQAMGSAKSK